MIAHLPIILSYMLRITFLMMTECSLKEWRSTDRQVKEPRKRMGRIWEYKLVETEEGTMDEAATNPRYNSTQHERDALTDFDFKTTK